jgi:RHS repeat-associated protein
MPFGEELGAGIRGRTTGMGFSVADGLRQKFTSKERDNETGLDYFLARYYASTQGRFNSYDPVFVTAKRLIDPQRLNLYAYARNNPLKFIDPNGADITITAKNEEEARKKFKTFQAGLRPEDRKHVQFFVGDGKNGYGKGQFYIKADKDYKSESGNFQGIQKAANDRTAVGRLTVVTPGDTMTWRITYLENRRFKLGVHSFKFEGEFDGYTVFQFRGKHEEIYSAGRYTEAFIRGDQDELELAATMHHELRAHILLGDFGRSVPRSRHSDPYARGQGPPTSEADKVGEAAEKEARENAAKRP